MQGRGSVSIIDPLRLTKLSGPLVDIEPLSGTSLCCMVENVPIVAKNTLPKSQTNKPTSTCELINALVQNT